MLSFKHFPSSILSLSLLSLSMVSMLQRQQLCALMEWSWGVGVAGLCLSVSAGGGGEDGSDIVAVWPFCVEHTHHHGRLNPSRQSYRA